MPTTIDRSLFAFHAETQTFVAEDSDLQINRHPAAGHWSRLLYLILTDPDEGDIEFRFERCDEQHGDIAGWRYKERYGDRQALIIND